MLKAIIDGAIAGSILFFIAGLWKIINTKLANTIFSKKIRVNNRFSQKIKRRVDNNKDMKIQKEIDRRIIERDRQK